EAKHLALFCNQQLRFFAALRMTCSQVFSAASWTRTLAGTSPGICRASVCASSISEEVRQNAVPRRRSREGAFHADRAGGSARRVAITYSCSLRPRPQEASAGDCRRTCQVAKTPAVEP